MSEKILKRLKKMLAQEQGERDAGNIETAKNIAVMISELLAKHKLELSDVERTKEEEKNPFSYEIIEPNQWGGTFSETPALYITDVALTIAQSYYCRVIYYDNSNHFAFIGRLSDIEITKYVFFQVMRAAMGQCETELAEMLLTPSVPYPKGSIMEFLANIDKPQTMGDDYRASFFYGLNVSISRRLEDQKRKNEAFAGTSTALVKADKDVENYLQSLGAKEETPEQRQKMIVDRIATQRGAAFGQSVNLSPYGLDTDTIKQLGD